MRDSVTLLRLLSLVGCKPRIISFSARRRLAGPAFPVIVNLSIRLSATSPYEIQMKQITYFCNLRTKFYESEIKTQIFTFNEIIWKSCLQNSIHFLHISFKTLGWVGLWGFLWWAPSAQRKYHHGSALDGAVFDIAQILAYLVHNMSRSQLYLGVGHFGWLPSFFGQYHFGVFMVKLYFICWNYSLSSGWHTVAA